MVNGGDLHLGVAEMTVVLEDFLSSGQAFVLVFLLSLFVILKIEEWLERRNGERERRIAEHQINEARKK
jgi:hypothetical protein